MHHIVCTKFPLGTICGKFSVRLDVQQEAERRKVKLLMVPTEQAVAPLNEQPSHTNAVLHVTS
jgi:hypothetical protein